jgi:hypothetical protein
VGGENGGNAGVDKSRGIETRITEAFAEVSPMSENEELRNQKFRRVSAF